MKYILRENDPNFTPQESSKVESSEEESSREAAAVIDPDSKLLTAPPMPSDEQSTSVPYNQKNENFSVLLGIINWSVVGIVVTAVLIVILNLKGSNSEFVFSRKRYRKKTNYNHF